MVVKSLVDAIEHDEWTVKGWQIKFIFSEKLLHQVRKLSIAENWYEDPILLATGIDRLALCFTSIQEYYHTFGLLPQVGDRLFDEDTGVIVQDRSIDGSLKTITFTLTI